MPLFSGRRGDALESVYLPTSGLLSLHLPVSLIHLLFFLFAILAALLFSFCFSLFSFSSPSSFPFFFFKVMALEHKELPFAAVQFHPESILTNPSFGLAILSNAINVLQYKK